MESARAVGSLGGVSRACVRGCYSPWSVGVEVWCEGVSRAVGAPAFLILQPEEARRNLLGPGPTAKKRRGTRPPALANGSRESSPACFEPACLAQAVAIGAACPPGARAAAAAGSPWSLPVFFLARRGRFSSLSLPTSLSLSCFRDKLSSTVSPTTTPVGRDVPAPNTSRPPRDCRFSLALSHPVRGGGERVGASMGERGHRLPRRPAVSVFSFP